MKKVVDQAGFEAISCHRCGDCCERMVVTPGPDERVAQFADTDRHYADMTHEESLADALTIKDMLEVIEVCEDGTTLYRCRHFTRDSEGLGVCGIYERRPWICSAFPYGEPNASWPRCAWNVHRVAKSLPMAPVAPIP